MQTSIKKNDAFQDRFFLDFDGFWDGKRSQVGSKIMSEIAVNFERPIFTKTYKTIEKIMFLWILWPKLGPKMH